MAGTAAKASSCFVYGTLMSPNVLKVLLGRVPTMMPKAALLKGHVRHPVLNRVYPGVIPSPSTSAGADTSVEGVLLRDITPTELKILDYFEDDDYVRSNVQITIPCINEDGQSNDCKDRIENADAYIWALDKSTLDLSRDWDYDAFVAEHLEWYLERTVKPCRLEIQRTILQSSG